MQRFVASTLWILAGSGAAGAAYWGFLNTPESTASALALSAILVGLTIALLGWTLSGAVLIWRQGWSRDTVRAAAGNIPMAIPALAIALAVMFAAATARAWVFAGAGEIGAWFIAWFDWAGASAFFATVTWAARWLIWVAGPVLAVSLLASMLPAGWAAAASLDWVRHAISPVRLILCTLWCGALVFAPWVYLAPWRPRGVPPTSLELTFVVAKLGVTAVVMAAGAALVVRQAAD
jgi:hypothetical protein